MAQQLNKANGTQLAVIGTEHTLDTEAAAGIFTITVDLTNLANGDVVKLRAYEKTLSGSTEKLLYEADYANLQGDAAAPGSKANGPVIVASPAIVSGIACVFTLHQPTGTGRNFDWRVDQLA